MTDLTVVQALANVMEEVRSVRKGDRNSQQGYSFRGIDAVVNAVGPILRSHKVIVVPLLESVNYRDVQTSGGKPSRECTVSVRYRFYGPSGDYIDAVTPGESMDFGDKGAPKAMSVAFRIALLQALCLPTDEPDPDSHSYEREAPAVGRGQRPNPPEDKFGGTDPEEILPRLRADCTKMGWDLNVVAGLWDVEVGGTTLKECRDAARINKFWKSLAARSDKDLKKPAEKPAKVEPKESEAEKTPEPVGAK
jgi:hypothetical protein